MLVQPNIFKNISDLRAAESTRHGGVSAAPYHTLNLGKNTADAPASVAENRLRFCAALGFLPEQMAWSYQVHGNELCIVAQAGANEGYDALMTNQKGILLSVSVADCTPILICDPLQGAIAAIHAGWRGTVAGIVAKTLQQMHDTYGTLSTNCVAYVGTCIGLLHFEVGDEVAGHFEATHKVWDPARQKYRIDLKAANASQLEQSGVPVNQIEISPFCTIEHAHNYFSHRLQQGITGRMVAAIGWKMPDF